MRLEHFESLATLASFQLLNSRGIPDGCKITELSSHSRTQLCQVEAAIRSMPQDVIERRFWKEIATSAPLYGADIEGSLFDESVEVACCDPHLNSLCPRCRMFFSSIISCSSFSTLSLGPSALASL